MCLCFGPCFKSYVNSIKYLYNNCIKRLKNIYNHKATFNSRSKGTTTELSNYIWDLKDRAVEYHTTWRIIKQAPSFNSNYLDAILHHLSTGNGKPEQGQ